MSIIPAEYLDPDDDGQRYRVEHLSGTLWTDDAHRWGIVDRNTMALMRGTMRGEPNNRAKYIWRATRERAQYYCDQLNASVAPRLIDVGTGPEMPGKRVDVGVIIGQARKRASVTPAPPVFVRCETCTRCHRPGNCP